MQIWKSDQKGDDKIIAFFNQTIYKANPKPEEVDGYISDLKMQNIPTRNAIEIPLSYIKQISMQEGKNYIEVSFGQDSSEHLRIGDDKMKTEIFNFFKQNVPTEYSVDKYSKFRAGRSPLIAMFIVGILFIWTLSIAIGIENGSDYDVTGKQYHSLAGIILVLAYLGVKNVVIIFGSLLSIAVYAFIKKSKSPPIIQRLQIKR